MMNNRHSSPDRDALLLCCDGQDTDALLILRRGDILLEYGDMQQRFLCHSMRKSFLSALIGIQATRGCFDLSLTLAALDIDDIDALSDIERSATLHDLLTARSGIYHPANYETPWMTRIKPPRHSQPPGCRWSYNNWDFNALGSAYRQLTGLDIHQAFFDQIAQPLGMADFRREDGWMEPGALSRHAAYPFRLSTRDLARFGQLFLQQGMWRGQQIIPAAWVRRSLMPYSHAGDRGAYGYMWWLARDGVALPGCELPGGSYFAYGAGGHYCLMLPTLDAVVVHRVNTDIAAREINRFQFGRLINLTLAFLAASSGEQT
ncbi:serine hydrolase domain-containing protein [Acerihabitans arboris]|uniref:Serine hydrolase n=1 Tax=Acerihabitans arboris TaxID=2691583 RepID=A0A845SF81_9GAMM|nr:serine hydrolase [Acerihabitans arboris]NDL61746.1 serine hydrolase [Acerihabitans arboris]